MFKHFIVGSSVAATVITLTYTGMAYRKAGRPTDVPFEMIAIAVPVLFGLMNVLNMYLQETTEYNTYVIAGGVGALTGLLFSLLGRFGLDLPQKIFQLKNENIVHLVAPLMYVGIFLFVLTPLNRYSA